MYIVRGDMERKYHVENGDVKYKNIDKERVDEAF